MKKKYISPLVEYIEVDQEVLLEGSTDSSTVKHEAIDSYDNQDIDTRDQSEDKDIDGDSGAKMASWTFSAGEDW